MKQRTSIRIVACIIVIACANMAGAQWYSTPSQNRGYGSSAYGAGSTTYYNNANGSSAGSSYRTGSTTYYNNANGSAAGSSYRSGNTTYYNNANGSSAGSSYRTGNTTYYNSANGSSAGMFRIFLGTFSPKELKSIGKLEIKGGHMKGDRFIE